MARILYENGKKIGEVEDWQQREDAAVYKTFLGKTALVAPSTLQCSFVSPKPVKRKSAFTVVEDGKPAIDLDIVSVKDGTVVTAKIRKKK